ncbi:MAG: glycosyltransferase family 2 protein [bacterium]
MNIHDIKVSTIIPSYNKHHYLQEALFSALNQTHENQEIIIINDYPTIQSREEVQEIAKVDPRIRVLHNPQNIGIARSRNKGIAVSK